MTSKPLAPTVARGYGARHRKLRDQIAPKVAAGQAICWRCQRHIAPNEPWDLGHDDTNRNYYRGPEHRACNRGARAPIAQADTSRRW